MQITVHKHRIQRLGSRLLILGLMVTGLCTCSPPTDLRIGIQPYGNPGKSICDSVAMSLRKNLHATVYVLPVKPMPTKAFTQIKSPRYRTDVILQMLKSERPDSLDYMLALTDHDISVTKREPLGLVKEPASTYADWGVFGYGYMPGHAAAISTFRLKHRDRNLFVTRVKKVALHELGHNLGLDHCPNAGCVMRDAAETIKTIDQVKLSRCTSCRKL